MNQKDSNRTAPLGSGPGYEFKSEEVRTLPSGYELRSIRLFLVDGNQRTSLVIRPPTHCGHDPGSIQDVSECSLCHRIICNYICLRHCRKCGRPHCSLCSCAIPKWWYKNQRVQGVICSACRYPIWTFLRKQIGPLFRKPSKKTAKGSLPASRPQSSP